MSSSTSALPSPLASHLLYCRRRLASSRIFENRDDIELPSILVSTHPARRQGSWKFRLKQEEVRSSPSPTRSMQPHMTLIGGQQSSNQHWSLNAPLSGSLTTAKVNRSTFRWICVMLKPCRKAGTGVVAPQWAPSKREIAIRCSSEAHHWFSNIPSWASGRSCRGVLCCKLSLMDLSVDLLGSAPGRSVKSLTYGRDMKLVIDTE